MRSAMIRPCGPLKLSIAGAMSGALMIVAAAATAHAQGVVIQSPSIVIGPPATQLIAPYAPPAVQTEVIPAAPDDSVIWHPGHWVWENGNWAWDAGHYVARPRRTAMWEPGHWAERSDGGYVWLEGHWN
jgi:WXXGXW repeat (2 copies)